MTDPKQKSPPMDRRDFLRVGGTVAATTVVAGCKTPAETSVPFNQRPEGLRTNGKAKLYATVLDGVPVHVRTREGRPIAIVPNPNEASGKSLTVRSHAALMDLYDPDRCKGPVFIGRGERPPAKSGWAAVDAEVVRRLAQPGAVLLTGPVTGPATLELIGDLGRKLGLRHVSWSPIANDAATRVWKTAYPERAPMRPRLDRADFIVGFGAEFIDQPADGLERDFASRRTPNAKMGQFVQLEGRLTLTGANADRRVRVRDSLLGNVAAAVAHKLIVERGMGPLAGNANLGRRLARFARAAGVDKKLVDSLANSLARARGRSLAIAGGSASASGSDTLEAAVFLINYSLGNFSSPLFEERAAPVAGGISDLTRLVRDMQDGRVKTLIVAGANPVYDAPIPFADAMEKVEFVVSLADRIDETAARSDYLAPASHALEAWGDADLGGGVVAVQQPVIRPLNDTRGLLDILLTWAAGAGVVMKTVAGAAGPAHGFLQSHWVSRVLPSAASWGDVLGSGFLVGGIAAAAAGAAAGDTITEKPAAEEESAKEGGRKKKAGRRKGAKKRLAAKEKEGGTEEIAEERGPRLPVAVVGALGGPAAEPGELELQLYPHFALHDGRSANNGWLLELPDPITRITWAGAVSVAPRRFDEMGLKNGDLVEVGVAGITRTLPAYRHAGMHQDQIAVPLGLGREACGKIGNGVGSNAFGLQQVRGDQLVRAGLAATLSKKGGHEELAFGQGGDVVDRPRRPVVPLTTLSSYKKNPASGTEQFPGGKSAWPEHPYPNQRWGMTIDLSKCNGCGKCSLACQAENNIPVVGRQGILQGREMAWMRIDRYYDAPAKEGGWGDDVYEAPVEVVEEPVTVFEPMLCQHCENAPCETVCPFNATMHSEDGINQQVYNRCVGTRYCANNCPFKVRRYNWYEYSHRRDAALLNLLFPIMGRHADLNTRGRMQMKNNPEVTVRGRGVMEKCTFCVQRIRAARAEAIRAGGDKDALPDGAVVPACMESCPTGAIVFGDINDPGSRVSAMRNDPRSMRLLESIGVKPVVSYLTKVRNDNA